MLIWTIAILIVAVLGVSSFYKGAVRSLVSLVGLFVAIGLALPLSGPLRPLVPKLGLDHPVWPWVLPPVIVFLVVVIVFTALGFLAHHKIHLHFKYATDDYTRLRWERLNRRLGLCVGVLAGCIYTVLVGLGIYIFGYPAVQVTNEGSPTSQRLLADARQQLQQTGLDKSVAALDPMPENFYLITDLVGLVYHNNSLHERLANYPAFLEFGQRNEFTEIVTDPDIMGGLQTQAPILPIVNNPKILGLLDNPEIMDKLRQLDLKDLHQYLLTGVSPKYTDEPILGRWRLNVSDTYILARRQNPDMPAREMRMTKTLLVVWLRGLSLMATPERNVYVNLELTGEARAMVDAIRAAQRQAQDAAQADPYGIYGGDQSMMQRYGLGGAQPQQPQQPSGASLGEMAGIPGLDLFGNVGSGSWERRGSSYRISLRQGSATSRGTAEISDDTLRMNLEGMTLVFQRALLQ